MLSGLDKQRAHIIKMYSDPAPCPMCGGPVTVFEALGLEVPDINAYPPDPRVSDFFDMKRSDDEGYACTHCQSPLRFAMPIIAIGPGYIWQPSRTRSGGRIAP